jgi:hypothetical protein
MGLIFAFACTDKDAPIIVVSLAYPLVTSLGFLGLVIANLKKKYALNRCWMLLMVILIKIAEHTFLVPFLSLRYGGRNSDHKISI